MSKKLFIDNICERFGSLDLAIETMSQQIETGPIEVGLDLQVLFNALGREEDSFRVSNLLVQRFPQDARALFNHGWHWLKRNELRKGLALLEYGRAIKTYGMPEPYPSRMPLFETQLHQGCRIQLVLEGGLGDEIIHFRFGKVLTEKYGCKVGVICQPSLAQVFAREDWVTFVAQRQAGPGILHDAWLPGMSAALALGLEYQDIEGSSYLRPSPSRVSKWRNLLAKTAAGKIKVGIRWSGNPQFEHQQLRKFDPSLLINLRQIDKVQLYSLQRDNDMVDLPEEIVDLAPHLNDWDDTVAAMAEMDLIITSCTSIAHMAGALGCATWVIVPALPYFIWALPGHSSPWYNSVRLFRQTQYSEWDDVGKELYSALEKYRSSDQ